MSFTKPKIVKSFASFPPGSQRRISPTAFSNPIFFAKDSLITKPAESVASFDEKSLPDIGSHPTVLPYSDVTGKVPLPPFISIFLPLYENPPFQLVMPVVELLDSAIEEIALFALLLV